MGNDDVGSVAKSESAMTSPPILCRASVRTGAHSTDVWREDSDARVPEQHDPHGPRPSSLPEHGLFVLDQVLEPRHVVLDGRVELPARVVRRVHDGVECDADGFEDRLQPLGKVGKAVEVFLCHPLRHAGERDSRVGTALEAVQEDGDDEFWRDRRRRHGGRRGRRHRRVFGSTMARRVSTGSGRAGHA